MNLEPMLIRRITGIRPFNKMPVDAEIWREAHAQHHAHRALHAVSAHRPGIVFGLEVIASQSQERTLLVAPGIAIDSEGQTVVLSEPVSFTVEESRQIFIVLAFQRAVDRNSALSVDGGTQYFREVEGRDLKQTRELPSGPYLELARVFRSGAEAPLRDATLAHAPTTDEINLLHRVQSFPFCVVDMTVGEVAYVPAANKGVWNPNRAGLRYLLSAGGNQGFHLNFLGPVNLRLSSQPFAPILLYMAGGQGFQPFADADVDGLRRFLDHGGTLFAEASQGNKAFADSFQELAVQLGANLTEVTAGHPLLTAHHVFSAPPNGAHAHGKLLSDTAAGIVFGTCDYGAAWQGDIERPTAPDARDRIRLAQEFGMNILAFAAQCQRLKELSRLS